MNYITLYQAQKQLGLIGNNESVALLSQWIELSSRLVEVWRGRRFDVFKNTYLCDMPMQDNKMLGDYYTGEYSPIERSFAKELFLDTGSFDLLEVIELLNGDGEEITDYILEPTKFSKKNRLFLKRGTTWATDDEGETKQVISLTGFFGFNRNYPNCFIDSREELGTDITDEITTISVADINGSASDYVTPRFQAGQMLRLSSDNGIEFINVVATNEDDYGDELVLERGINGTLPLAHSSGTKIEIYRPDGDVVQIVLRLVQWRYRQKDQDSFDKVYDLASNTLTVPTGIPTDIRAILGPRKPRI